VRRLAFLRGEIAELPAFAQVELSEYDSSRSRGREMERWAENIANATIDLAKIVLAAERSPVPQSYREALTLFGRNAGLSEEDATRLEGVGRLRSLLAHEYLDLLYERIRFLVEELPAVYERLVAYVGRCVDQAPTGG